LLKTLLTPEVRAFIDEHENDDIGRLLLKYRSIDGVPFHLIADQIRGRQKAKVKLPFLYQQAGTIYPPVLNVEQSSSEQTASFKLDFIKKILNGHASSGADLTGGMGVDTYFLSRIFAEFHCVEPDGQLLEITKNNLKRLATNIIFHQTKAEQFLSSTPTTFDLIYSDPSRRTAQNKKVVRLQDCEPNVVILQDEIYRHAPRLLIKISPLLDIQHGMAELRFVKTVIVLAIANECKELLFFCERDFQGEVRIEGINVTGAGREQFSFTLSEERETVSDFKDPQVFLYEPNAAIRKAGAFKLVGRRFNLAKVHKNTHLFTSHELVAEFPGRIFRILASVKPSPKEVEKFFPDKKANVISRNYPLTAEQLKKKTHLQDGGELFLIGFTSLKAKSLVVASRLK
jgi:hypothetical protein